MSSVVNFNNYPPGSNPYLQDPEFYKHFQNQFSQPSQMHQPRQNLYQANQKFFQNQPPQWQQGRQAQSSSNFSFPAQSYRQPLPIPSPDQAFYPGHRVNARSTPLPQYQYQQSGTEYQGSNSYVTNGPNSITPDQSLMSPSVLDSSGLTVSSPEQSPNLLQYQWEGFNANSHEFVDSSLGS